MKFDKNTFYIAYVVISLIAIGLLIYFLVKCNSESFCLCRGVAGKECPNIANKVSEYNKGTKTEYTNLATEQGTPHWRENTMPEDKFEKQLKMGSKPHWREVMPADRFQEQLKYGTQYNNILI